MTQPEIIKNIHRGLDSLRLMQESSDQPDSDPAQQISDALAFALRVADSTTQESANAVARADQTGLRAFLALADRLDISTAGTSPGFSIPSLIARNEFSSACEWLSGALHTVKGLKAGLLQD